EQPQPFNINVPNLINNFKIGYRDFGAVWSQIIAPENFKVIEELLKKDEDQFVFPVEVWAKILYDLAVAFHYWKRNRQTLVNLMTPLYFARIASFVNRTRDMSNEEAEEVVEEQAQIFEDLKPYLLERWDQQPAWLDKEL
ncbi:MAG: glycosyl transferase family 2, partial [Calditrichaeota bacterium]